MEEHVPGPEIINVTELAVEALVDKVMREEQVCTCRRCTMDVTAIALNALPPQYVVSEEGRICGICKLQGSLPNKVAVYRAVLEAVQMVKQRPHHERGRCVHKEEP